MALTEIALLAAAMFIFSLLTIAGSALYLVRALLHIAKKIGVSEFVIGLTVLSIACAMPEFLNTLISAIRGIGELGIGDVIGASIVDLCLTLGIVSLITKSKLTPVENHIFIYSIFTVLVFTGLAFDGRLSRIDGLIMLCLFILYQYLSYKKGITLKLKHIPFKSIATAYIIAPLAVFSLIVSAFLLVSSSSMLAFSIGVPVSVVGLLLVSIGTSAPEFASGVTSAIRHGEGLAFGTTLGAIVLHFFFAAGSAALISPFSFDFAPFKIPLMILMAAILTFTVYVNIRKYSDKYLGMILIALYALYVYLSLIGAIVPMSGH